MKYEAPIWFDHRKFFFSLKTICSSRVHMIGYPAIFYWHRLLSCFPDCNFLGGHSICSTEHFWYLHKHLLSVDTCWKPTACYQANITFPSSKLYSGFLLLPLRVITPRVTGLYIFKISYPISCHSPFGLHSTKLAFFTSSNIPTFSFPLGLCTCCCFVVCQEHCCPHGHIAETISMMRLQPKSLPYISASILFPS